MANINGRPPIYKTPEEMQSKIDEYFNGAMRTRTKYIKIGDETEAIEVPAPTISGLCLFLGFESRQSFYDYEQNANFSYTIKRARTFIEREYEELLQFGNVTGAIFALKNLGWLDQKQLDHTTAGESMNRQPLDPETAKKISDDLEDEV